MASRRRPNPVPVVLLVLLSILTACGSTGSESRKDPSVQNTFREGDKRGTGERRTDPAPLTERFPALGEPEAVEWYSGTLGNDRAPGPSSYWIDARVTLSASAMQTLLAQHATTAASDVPDVVSALQDGLGTAALRSGPDLDEALSTGGFTTHVWVDRAEHLLVLSAKGQ